MAGGEVDTNKQWPGDKKQKWTNAELQLIGAQMTSHPSLLRSSTSRKNKDFTEWGKWGLL